MLRPHPIAGLIALIVLTSGCRLNIRRQKIGLPQAVERAHQFETGRTTLAQVLARCGAPDLLVGRIDDVMNVSGHRIGTMEVESAIVSHKKVAEAAVVGRPDDITGTAIVAFVTPIAGQGVNGLDDEVRKHVTREIGAIAKPKDIRFTDALPKTRSGKIMRRLLRDIASGKETVGDTSTLEDYSVLAGLREADED